MKSYVDWLAQKYSEDLDQAAKKIRVRKSRHKHYIVSKYIIRKLIDKWQYIRPTDCSGYLLGSTYSFPQFRDKRLRSLFWTEWLAMEHKG